MEKLSYEQAYKEFAEQNLTLLETTYKNVDVPMRCANQDGYLFFRSLRTVRHMGKNKTNNNQLFSLKNKYCWDNVLHYMEKEVSTGTTLLSSQLDYHGGETPLTFKCGCCGRVFVKRWYGFVNADNKICSICYKALRPQEEYVERRRISREQYEVDCTKKGLKLISIYGNNCGGKAEVEDQEGYKGIMTLSRLRSGSTFEKFAKSNPYTLYNMRIFAQERCIIPDQLFVGDKAMMRFVCNCGNEFTTSLTHFINDQKFRCNQCRVKYSNISLQVERWLQDNKVSFEKEYRCTDCVGKSGLMLPFDFYLNDFHALIEVDGIQHYKPVAFGGDKDKAKEMFCRTQENDNIKTLYCHKNSVPLLRLPFWEIEHSDLYKERLEQFILSLQA